MRPLEIVLIGLTAALALSNVIPALRNPRLTLLLAAAAAVVAALHLVIEHYRWQMVPIYTLLIVFWLAALARMLGLVQLNGAVRVLLTVLAALALIIGAALPAVFPVPSMPKPRGPLQVGTQSFYLKDFARDEVFTNDPNDKRELMIQVWYPAAPVPGSATAPWLPRADVLGPIIARFLTLPSFMFDHIGLAGSNSVERAPIAPSSAPYPVLVYSHGWAGFRQVNQNQSEALASHGYIVVSIDHTYGAMFSVFDDGRVQPNKPELLPAKTAANYVPAIQLLQDTYARDVTFVLDQLSDAKRVGTGQLGGLARNMDLERIGLFGHSTGAGAIVTACSRDPRCKAGVGQDTWVEPAPDAVIASGVRQPFLFIRSEAWADGLPNDQRLLTLRANSQAQMLTIRGAEHYDFVMIPLFSPLAPLLGLKGPIPATRVIPLIDEAMLIFFDTNLRGLPDGDARMRAFARDYPEARID